MQKGERKTVGVALGDESHGERPHRGKGFFTKGWSEKAWTGEAEVRHETGPEELAAED